MAGRVRSAAWLLGRARWLARLILSAAEMVQFLRSFSLSFASCRTLSDFRSFFRLLTPAYSLRSHFHLSLCPATVSSRPRLFFSPSYSFYLAASLLFPALTPVHWLGEGDLEPGGGLQNAWLATLLDAPDESVRPGVDDDAAEATLAYRSSMRANGGWPGVGRW